MTVENGEGGKNILQNLPERLIIVPVKTLPFPGNKVVLGLTKQFFESVKAQSVFIATPFFPAKRTVPPIGVLTRIEGEPSPDPPHKIPSHFLQRVRIYDIKRLVSEKGLGIYDCAWSKMDSEEISESAWESPQVQSLVARLKSALMPAFVSLHFFLLDSEGNMEKSSVNPDFKARRIELEFLLGQLWVVGRKDIGFLMDQLAGRITEFYSHVMPAGNDSVVVRDMRPIFFSGKVEERLSLIVEHFEKMNQGDDPRRGEVNDDSNLPKNVREKIERLADLNPESAEGQTAATYVEWLRTIFSLKPTKDEEDFAKVRSILEEDHYGLEKIKEKILEFLAVRKTQPKAKGLILCIVGPPGVGKTSLGKSIARATGRRFVRRSLAGVKDEADLRGHRRTYIGAIPGMIIDGLRSAKSKNPVFMLDQVDLLGEHGKDVPENALIEVLDPEQNNEFIDHYLDVPCDISEVLFICTANTIEGINDALRNRMKIIEVPGYSDEEKAIIARRYTIAKTLKEFGIEPENFKAKGLPPFTIHFSDKALSAIIGDHTYDAGMRDTEHAIQDIAAKVLLDVEEGKLIELLGENDREAGSSVNVSAGGVKIVTISPGKVPKYLGKIKQSHFPDLGNPKVGVAFCLAVSTMGQGCVFPVGVSIDESEKFKIIATGYLSKVMEESARAAFSRLVHRGGILDHLSHKYFVHLHAGDGAVPKDGPSAGVVILSAIYSCLTCKPLKPYFAATGELDNKREFVTKIGGVKGKLLEARKVGILEVAIPLDNRDDLDELPWNDVRVITPEDLKNGKSWKDFSREKKPEGSFTVYCVERPEDVLELAFPNDYPPPKEALEKERKVECE